jgi:hypothetical protein
MPLPPLLQTMPVPQVFPVDDPHACPQPTVAALALRAKNPPNIAVPRRVAILPNALRVGMVAAARDISSTSFSDFALKKLCSLLICWRFLRIRNSTMKRSPLFFAPFLLTLPAFAQGTLINARGGIGKSFCPNATAALPQVAVYTGGAVPVCYGLGNLTLDNVNKLLVAPSGTSQRSVRESVNLTTGATVSTRPDGTIHLGWQTSKTPVLGSPVWIRWSNVDASGVTTDWFLADPVASDGTRVLDVTLPRQPIAGDTLSIVYSTVEP